MNKKSKLIRSDTGGRRWQVGDHEKESYRRRHFDAYRSSGLSTRAYCAQNGLAYSSFIGWRKRLEEVTGKAAVPVKVVSQAKASEKVGNPFVPIPIF
jgi:tRNA A37 threonylcarbamoyladenosine biosynthesis protein TsaE